MMISKESSSKQVDKYKVMIVDDAPDNIMLFSELLKEHYHVRVALNGEKALRLIKKDPPDIILLDVMMPVLDGYETCRILKQDETLRDIPVIFLTAKNDSEDENTGLNLGAVDYITKPVNPKIFLSRIKAQLSAKIANDLLKDRNHYLEEEVAIRTKEVTLLQELSVMAMSSLAEIRDNETGYHLQRTKLYAKLLCEQLIRDGKYSDEINQDTINTLVNAVPLHDIGKVGIPDSILLKPGKLTTEEFEFMKHHANLGKESIEKAERMMDCPSEYMKFPKEIAYCHHEKWDGKGYPRGISGNEIPVAARIVALVDVYDALRSRRVYKPAFSQEETLRIILEEKDKHFDGTIIDAFLELKDEFFKISTRYAD